MRIFPIAVALAALVAACSSAETTSTSAAGGAGAQGGAGGAVGGGGTTAACEGDVPWSESTAMGMPRDHHGTFIADTTAGPFLYVAGGTNYTQLFDDVRMAPIAADGSVGAWSTTTSLPTARTGFGVVQQGDEVILLGGRTLNGGLTDIAEVVRTTLGADGQLGPWSDLPPLPSPRFHLAAMLADNGYVYATGGLDGTTSSSSVFYARLEAGNITAWTEAAMTRPRSHHASWTDGGYLYVAGGLDGNPAGSHESLVSVERAPLSADGTLGAWEPLTSLPVPVSTHNAAVDGRCVYMSGGIADGSMHSNVVRRTDLLTDGTLSSWVDMVSVLPQPRSHIHHTPIYDGRIYVVGGSIGLQSVTDAVAVGALPRP